MRKKRVVGFIDGFNLYHAIDDLDQPHLKWLDLWKLCETFVPRSHFDLKSVLYFSAYATWRPGPYKRHRTYVEALRATGVTPLMAKFKEKRRGCRNCGIQWTAHEEKESDVSLAIELLSRAGSEYDLGLLITGDSDISPAVRRVLSDNKECELKVLTPVGRRPSYELLKAAGKDPGPSRLKIQHLERSLLPRVLRSKSGEEIFRPAGYDPPHR